MASFEHSAADTTPMEQDEKKQKQDHGHGHSHAHAEGESAAKIVALGTLTVGGATFTIDREGQVEAGATTEFGVELISGTGVPSQAWLANPDGTKVCDPVSSETHNSHWHFNVEPLMPVKKSKFVLKVGEEEAALDWHRGAEPSNEGIMSIFKAANDPAWRGYLELKLHGDAGDLELWLTESFAGVKPKPMDVPKETVMKLTFPSHPGKSLEMRVRNMDKNEDEDGKANMRGGGTNYFIFPGETGADAGWITGEDWRGLAVVAFEVDGKSYASDPFVLVPHEKL